MVNREMAQCGVLLVESVLYFELDDGGDVLGDILGNCLNVVDH